MAGAKQASPCNGPVLHNQVSDSHQHDGDQQSSQSPLRVLASLRVIGNASSAIFTACARV